MEMAGTGFDAGSVVIARAGASLDASKDEVERIKVRREELIERIKAEPGVAGVTFTSSIPGFGFSDEVRFEDGVKVSATPGHVPDVGITNALWPSVIRGSLDLFEVFGVQMVAGRNFAPSDLGADNVVINRGVFQLHELGVRRTRRRSRPSGRGRGHHGRGGTACRLRPRTARRADPGHGGAARRLT